MSNQYVTAFEAIARDDLSDEVVLRLQDEAMLQIVEENR